MIAPVLPTYTRAPLSFVKGEGSWLVAADGRRFLDMGAGIGVMALGHSHPALVDRLAEQGAALWHVSNLYTIPEQEELAERLVAASFADTCFFTNSGTEACELAVKMARRHFHAQGEHARTRIIAFEGSFHGRSSAAIAAAGSAKLAEGFAPLLPGFTQVPFGDIAALKAEMAAGDVAAVIAEPVQGEGGIRLFPDEALREMRALCDAAGALLILDEVQCGMGRTGRLFAHEWAGIAPDIMMVAKGIGGGFPLGAVLATEAAAAAMGPGTHGSTYGGNPLACAIGCKVMEIISDPGFLADVSRKAGLLRQKLEGLVDAHPDVFEAVRGQGLMLGLVCRAPCADVVEAGHAQEVLTVPAAGNVVRLLPPLTISEEEIAEAVERLERAAGEISKGLNS